MWIPQEEPPPVLGIAALLMVWAMVVIITLVPLLMGREPSDDAPPVPPAPPTDPDARFSSEKERRLWIWTAVVMLAIYSTLAPAAEVAAFLRERNLLRLTNMAVMLTVVTALAIPWLERRPGSREIGAAIAIAAVYMTTLIRMPYPEARSHLYEYSVVSILIYHALAERRRNGRRVPAPWLLAMIATLTLGWIDEAVQFFIPSRTYDLVDVGLNAVAAVMGVLASVVMAWARNLDLLKRIAGEPSRKGPIRP